MQGLPFEIPESLQPYISQFESDPESGIANLKAHIKKRGMDAVGFSLLAWLCQENGNQEDALKYALKAKVCAPGSPFIEYLHYFLIHP
ncbi:hypothetical protein QLX67_13380, partial [Balneolaceae bacterium ANBcel3]|nr:hypothetical protein [Balneolaceae bacterium ANBcel3]